MKDFENPFEHFVKPPDTESPEVVPLIDDPPEVTPSAKPETTATPGWVDPEIAWHAPKGNA